MVLSAASASVLWAMVGALATVGALLVAALALWLPKRDDRRREAERARQVRDVILGVEHGPGIEERPSLVDRFAALHKYTHDFRHETLGTLEALEKHQTALDRMLTKVGERTAQLEPNGGNSLADRVGRIEVALADTPSRPANARRRTSPKENP